MANKQKLILVFYLCPECGYHVGLYRPVRLLRCGNCGVDMKNLLDFENKDFYAYYTNPRIAARAPELAKQLAIYVAPKPQPTPSSRVYFKDMLDAQLHHLLNQDLDKLNDLHKGKWAGQAIEFSDFEKWVAIHALPESATRLLGGVRYLAVSRTVQRERF